MRIAREGFPMIGWCLFTTAGSWFISPVISAVLLIPLVLTVWFFRDPDRAPQSDNGWLSPADGRVVEIEETVHEYTGKAVKIGIFMNAFSVHVNRFPTSAKVEYVKYTPGRKWFAFAPKASEINERLYVGAESKDGRFLLVQIAGILARRIVCRVSRNDILDRGQRYGMIKLGSKVDIYLPPKIAPTVNIGDTVTGGETVIGVRK